MSAWIKGFDHSPLLIGNHGKKLDAGRGWRRNARSDPVMIKLLVGNETMASIFALPNFVGIFQGFNDFVVVVFDVGAFRVGKLNPPCALKESILLPVKSQKQNFAT